MATSLNLAVSKVIPTNITSSLAMSPEHTHFAALTRQLSTQNSQWIYRLDYYDAHSLDKIATIDVYSTYNTDKHFLTFVPNSSSRDLIAVATVNNLNFYRTNPMEEVKSSLHRQANVYDLVASPNGQLVVLVGQTITVYRVIGFKEIIFPQVLQNARYCDFSSDGFYMVIASTSSINLYTFQRLNDNYQFQKVELANSRAPVQYGAITSIQFNPTNSSELLVGYLSSSPGYFSIDNGGLFFKKLTDIQPMSSQNAKIARYMPDASRFYSFDYLNGVGLWPGLKDKLYYVENFLLYGASTNEVGTRLLGYVWQQIKLADITVKCEGGSSGATCPCSNGFAWDYANYKCVSLTCRQAQYATGQITGNSCQCISGFKWDAVKLKCAIDCSKISKALAVQPSLYQCYCGDNWSWNAFTRSCEFDCKNIPYSTGVLANSTACECISGFLWNDSLNQCQCPSYMTPVGSVCLCFSNYVLNTQGICVADCTSIPNSIGPGSTLQQCQCTQGYYFAASRQTAGCQLNCSAIADTMQEYDLSTCLCREHMDWLNQTCVVNCKVIDYADSVGLSNNTCACAINYHWRNTIKECARSCNGISYVNASQSSTLRSCPCIRSFVWSEANTRCEIQCDKIANSQQYSLSEYNICECRPGFLWNNSTYICEVDCSSIWNADGRVNDTHCTCKNDQPFNSTSLSCSSAQTAGIFSSTLSIVGLVIGCVVALVILIILLRFCWTFKTEKNEEHEKRIKGKDGKKKKKGKMLRQQKAPPMMEEDLKTDQRFVSPNKIRTATSL